MMPLLLLVLVLVLEELGEVDFANQYSPVTQSSSSSSSSLMRERYLVVVDASIILGIESEPHAMKE